MRSKPVRAVVRGAVAGAAGTIGMDLLWYSRYRSGGGEDGFLDWELSRGTEDWDHAATPGLVGRKVAEAIGVELPDSAAALTTNLVHWATGIKWGMLYAVAATRRPGIRSGVALGLVACSTSYVVLPRLGLYKPIWEYEAQALAQDYSAHAIFGAVTGAALWSLTRRS